MKRIFNAIKKYLFKDTKYFFLYVFRYFQNNYKNNCQFYTKEELVKLIESGKSIIRIGDGEIGLLHFLPIGYQEYSDSIRDDFLKIIKEYNDSSSYILMIPLFVNYTNEELKKENRFRCWMPLKITYELIFNKKACYFDQHIFYKDNQFKNLILPHILDKKIVVITNKENKEEIIKSGLLKNVFAWVICSNENTYEEKDKLKNEIIELINRSGFSKNNFVILMSAGLAKTIIFDLSKDGYQLFDIGKGLEGYYKNISLESLI